MLPETRDGWPYQKGVLRTWQKNVREWCFRGRTYPAQCSRREWKQRRVFSKKQRRIFSTNKIKHFLTEKNEWKYFGLIQCTMLTSALPDFSFHPCQMHWKSARRQRSIYTLVVRRAQGKNLFNFSQSLAEIEQESFASKSFPASERRISSRETNRTIFFASFGMRIQRSQFFLHFRVRCSFAHRIYFALSTLYSAN